VLTRLYVDNYRTFSNFELKPGRVHLLLGRNGTGKSSVLDVLDNLRALICDGRDLDWAFASETICGWSKATRQRFEIDVTLGADEFRYVLEIEHKLDGTSAVSTLETLHVSGIHLYSLTRGLLRLFPDDGKAGPGLSVRPTRSYLEAVAGNAQVDRFRAWLDAMLLVRPNPAALCGYAKRESTRLDPSLDNFAEWYRGLQQTRPVAVVAAQAALREVIVGFDELQVDVGAARQGHLRTKMRGPGGTYRVDFDHLSDGQRVLFVLYVILHAAADPGRLLVFDEPDNFVALSELQPFLNELLDRTSEPDGPQVLLISHHPEFINPLAPTAGLVFFRQDGGPTRVKPFEADALLPAAEVVARGAADA
jgi:hypothetical protein